MTLFLARLNGKHMPSGAAPKIKRGDLARCQPCGRVFVAQANSFVVCRRCNGRDVVAFTDRAPGAAEA